MDNLSGWRRQAGYTQYELGKKTETPRSKIADVETGRAQFTPAERRRILAVLAVRIERNLKDLNAELDSTGLMKDENNTADGVGATTGSERSARRADHDEQR